MSELTTILGGKEIEIKYQDGSTQTIKVRELPIKKLDEFLQKIGDEDACIELYANQSAGWAATLSRESWEAVLDLGESLNLDFFMRRAKARIERQEKLMPGLKQKIIEAQEKAIQGAVSHSLNSAPASSSEGS
jgi:hypothetical protein